MEVNGSWHSNRAQRDARRERLLRAAGYHVLHVTAEEVLRSLLSALPPVAARIRATIAEACRGGR